MQKVCILIGSVVVVTACLTLAAEAAPASATTVLVGSKTPAGSLPVSLGNEASAAIRRGCDWLVAGQRPDGSWSDTNYPALTALPLWALVRSGDPSRKPAIDKAVQHILTFVQNDGGIYRNMPGRKGGGLSNYNTAICMTALFETGDAALIPVILKAREFVASAQHLGDDVYRGGFGYDKSTGRAYTDLLNTFYSVEALRLTAGAEDSRPAGSKKTEVNWEETVKFIERMQNPASAGTNNAGGFFYNPTDPKAGATTNAAGVVTLRSYGSMTYAGMLAMIYAKVNRNDHRVQSAFDWAAAHWTLEENPGMGAQGIYFFYTVLTRALSAYQQDLVPRKGAQPLNWREEVARKVVALQQVDPKTGGFWVNANNRYWENDPVLVTSYALLALEHL